MGILPLQFKQGETPTSLGLTGKESFDVAGLTDGLVDMTRVTATAADGKQITFEARVRIDTPQEYEYYCHGGILHYVLRQLAA
jgi:aconitate hydratase